MNREISVNVFKKIKLLQFWDILVANYEEMEILTRKVMILRLLMGVYKVGIVFLHPFSSAPTHKLNILIFQERGDGISPSDIDRYFHKRFDSPNYCFRLVKPFKLYICVEHINLLIK